MLELRGTLVSHRTLRYRFGFDKLASRGGGELSYVSLPLGHAKLASPTS